MREEMSQQIRRDHDHHAKRGALNGRSGALAEIKIKTNSQGKDPSTFERISQGKAPRSFKKNS